MYEFFKNLLSDHDNGIFTFEAFSLCHIIYLVLIIGAITLTIFLYRKKSQEEKVKLIDFTVTLALCLYIADFFLMPFSYGYINIDKLPFHVCTSMSIMSLLARKTKFFSKFKTAFSLMGMIGALMYLTYPAGVPSADGYSYRIVQTVLYHGLMIAQGIFAIAFEDVDLSWKTLKFDIIAIVLLVVWAYIGNTLYSGVVTEQCECVEGCIHTITTYDHDFNWFFVKHDALYVISDDIDMYFAPFIMIGSIFSMCVISRLIGFAVLKSVKKNKV